MCPRLVVKLVFGGCQKSRKKKQIHTTTEMRVGVGSTNPTKTEAVRDAFIQMGWGDVEVIGFNVPSDVSDQPMSDEETVRGAVNRAKHVMELSSTTDSPLDYGVGLEGGVMDSPFGMMLCNWGAVVDSQETVGVGGGHRILLPDSIAEGISSGSELGDVIDKWAGGSDIHKKEGTIGILTKNNITRTTMCRDVVICAFTRFLDPSHYAVV